MCLKNPVQVRSVMGAEARLLSITQTCWQVSKIISDTYWKTVRTAFLLKVSRYSPQITDFLSKKSVYSFKINQICFSFSWSGNHVLPPGGRGGDWWGKPVHTRRARTGRMEGTQSTENSPSLLSTVSEWSKCIPSSPKKLNIKLISSHK